MQRCILITASLILVGSMLAAYGQIEVDTANDSTIREYKAMARPDIEALGGRDERHAVHGNEALSRGLNKLAADDWVLTAIESANTRPIGGPAGGSTSNSATYVFAR